MLPILSKNNWEGGVTVAVHSPEFDSSSRDFPGTTCPSLSSKKEAASNGETRQVLVANFSFYVKLISKNKCQPLSI